MSKLLLIAAFLFGAAPAYAWDGRPVSFHRFLLPEYIPGNEAQSIFVGSGSDDYSAYPGTLDWKSNYVPVEDRNDPSVSREAIGEYYLPRALNIEVVGDKVENLKGVLVQTVTLKLQAPSEMACNLGNQCLVKPESVELVPSFGIWKKGVRWTASWQGPGQYMVAVQGKQADLLDFRNGLKIKSLEPYFNNKLRVKFWVKQTSKFVADFGSVDPAKLDKCVASEITWSNCRSADNDIYLRPFMASPACAIADVEMKKIVRFLKPIPESATFAKNTCREKDPTASAPAVALKQAFAQAVANANFQGITSQVKGQVSIPALTPFDITLN